MRPAPLFSAWTEPPRLPDRIFGPNSLALPAPQCPNPTCYRLHQAQRSELAQVLVLLSPQYPHLTISLPALRLLLSKWLPGTIPADSIQRGLKPPLRGNSVCLLPGILLSSLSKTSVETRCSQGCRASDSPF